MLAQTSLHIHLRVDTPISVGSFQKDCLGQRARTFTTLTDAAIWPSKKAVSLSLRSAQNQTVRRSDLDKDKTFLSYERPWEIFESLSNWLPNGLPSPSSQQARLWGNWLWDQPVPLRLARRKDFLIKGLFRCWRDDQGSWEISLKGLSKWGAFDLSGMD